MFQRARLLLTLQYLTIIMLISFAFSFIIYNVMNNEVDRIAAAQQLRLRARYEFFGFVPPPDFIDQDMVNDVHQRIIDFLILINSGIFLTSGALGYLLAGRTLQPIQEMLDEQHRFISDSSHEFRTPLTSLKSSMEVALRDRKLTLKEAKSLISENIDEVNHLQVLSDQLLKLTQYQQPQTPLKFEKISLLPLVQNAIKNVQGLASAKKIVLQNQVSNLEFVGNSHTLLDLFTILLDNAIKYSPQNSEVSLSSLKTKNHFKIVVSDHGIGIDPKDIPHIFDRFYRADSARSKVDAGGYGLGLSIAKKIVDSHHGTISATSHLGSGTSFIVKLPIHLSSASLKA